MLQDWASAIRDPGTVIVAVAGLLTTVVVTWLQSRSQERALKAAQRREDVLYERKFEEADRADRYLIIEYIDQVLPRLSQITSIHFLSSTEDNKNEDEREEFRQLKSFMDATQVDPAHPERTLSIRMAFLLFQLITAARIALNARWSRPLSDYQKSFLSHYECHLEPILCSGRYPGEEWLYREQIAIIEDEMTVQGNQRVPHPVNWREFCQKYQEGGVLRTLADMVASKFRFIFDDANHRTTPLRRSSQCRLAIMALYLIKMSEENGDSIWAKKAADIWPVVADWFAWEATYNTENGRRPPQWFVFTYGDVAAKSALLGPK